MKYKIVVDKQSRTNPSEEKREYEVDIEELRFKGDVYDSLVITKDEDYVMRRLELTDFYVLKKLETPIKEPLENINIELFEGDNYIYLIDMTGNKFYAEYLIKNDFNDTYVVKSEMKTAIEESAKGIELSVNQKLQNYSTTEEMNGAINVKASEIDAKVEKKVDAETITGAYLILKINGDTSEAKLNADKIELSASDILNLLAGNAINLTSKNITISSTNFNVDKNGNMTCNNGNFKGNIYLEDNKKVVGGDGLITNLQFSSMGAYLGFSMLGFNVGFIGSEYTIYNSDVFIEAVIPQNFTIQSAKITLEHTPAKWSGYDDTTKKDYDNWGYARNLKLYKGTSNYKFDMGFNSEYLATYESSLSEIANAFGTSYTPSNTSGDSIVSKESIDIKNYLTTGGNRLIIRTANSIPANVTSASQQTGMAKAVLNIIGYLKVS